MRYIKKLLLTFLFLNSMSAVLNAQVCIPTYSTVCYSMSTFDVIDNFWTTGGITNITNMDTDCSMLPDNYTFTGMAVTACIGETVETNVQCQVDEYVQGFAIWIDWNQNDIFELVEKVYSSPDASDAVYTGTFIIPGTATVGETYNMRVRSEFATAGSGIDPCDLQTFGETEDYLVIVGTCNPTICEGDSVELDLGVLPPGVISYVWSPATDISDPFGGPSVDVWPSDTTTYTCTITSADSTWDVAFDVNVIHAANPDAGLDDTICHSLLAPYPFDASIDVPDYTITMDWEMESFIGVGGPSLIFSPDDDILEPTVATTLPGIYEFVLYTIDPSGFCPDQSDTVQITFSKQTHTTAFTIPSCFGDADATITITGTGTLPTAEYSIDGGVTWQVSNVFTGLTSGTYSVKSKDVFGCEYTSTVIVTEPAEIELTLSSDTLVCRNGTATVTATASGGVSFTYDWSIPGSDDTGTQSFPPVVSPTNVTVMATNEFGCESELGTIVVTLRDPLVATISVNDSICPGFESTTSVTVTGGDGDYEYTWTANGSAMAETTPTITTSPLVHTTYCVTVNDGCETSPVTVCTETIINPVPVPVFISDITAGCNPSTVNFETTLLPGEEATWLMDGVNYIDYPTVSHEFSGVGFYDIFLEITNEFGCVTSITANDYIEMVDVPYPNFFINPNPTTIFNTLVTMNPNLEGDEYDYFWDMPGAIPATSEEMNPTVFYPEGIAGTYEITLTVTDEYGCTNDVIRYLEVIPDVIIYAPNMFTPDGDNVNNSWRIYMDGIDVYNYNCKVFNRWGEIVWESFDVTGTWNGTYGEKLVEDGTYVWIVNVKDRSTDKMHEFKGTVSVLR